MHCIRHSPDSCFPAAISRHLAIAATLQPSQQTADRLSETDCETSQLCPSPVPCRLLTTPLSTAALTQPACVSHINYVIDTTDNSFSMSQLPILTRAAEQEADITLQMPSTSTVSATVSSASSSLSSDPLESLWSQYEAYLESAQAAQEAGVDIFPQPAFVIKVGLLPPVKPTAAAAAAPSSEPQLEGDRLFINVCTDAAVDAPELVKATPEAALPRPDASSSSQPAASVPPGSLRLPMSVGPLSQCLSRSGVPSLCVDVVVHPDTVNLDVQQHQAQHEHAYSIALAQAAIIQRRDGVAPAVPSPAAAAAMTLQQVKRTVASLAIDKLQAKYGLRVDEQAELRFPQAALQGDAAAASAEDTKEQRQPAASDQQRQGEGEGGSAQAAYRGGHGGCASGGALPSRYRAACRTEPAASAAQR